MPVAAGLLAEGRSWTKKGPVPARRLVAARSPRVTVLGAALLFFIGVQPPNDGLLNYTGGPLGDHGGAVVRHRPQSASPAPPVGDAIAAPAVSVARAGRVTAEPSAPSAGSAGSRRAGDLDEPGTASPRGAAGTGWRGGVSQAMMPPSFISALQASNPHCRFS